MALNADKSPSPFRTINGAWWDSAHPDQRWSGELRLNELGSSRLELKTIALHDTKELPKVEEKVEARTFHGHDEHGRSYSLFGCVSSGSSRSTARVTRTRSGTCVVGGLRAASLDDLTFDEVWLDFSDLQEWLCTPLIREEHPKIPGKIVLNHMPETALEIPTSSGYTFVLTPSIGSSSSCAEVSFQLKQSLSLRFEKSISLRALQPIVLELQWFLSLGRGEPVRVLKVDGTRQGATIGETKVPEIIDVWKGWAGSELESPTQTRWEMLFTAEDIGNHLGPMLERWHAYREKHAAVLSSYFSTRFNRHLYSNHQFLFLAHALELYHQLNFDGAQQPPAEFAARLDHIAAAVPTEAEWLRQRLAGANRKTLADRLRQLLEAKSQLLGNLISDRERFVAIVRDTRNYYTHYDAGLRQNGRVAEGVELMKLSHQMQAVLEACFLNDLGAPIMAIHRVLNVERTYVPAP
jgi:hypothetical protein